MNHNILFVKLCLVISFNLSCQSKKPIIEKVDISTKLLNNSIEGKILAGYQGWFNAEKDGSELGWKHYGNKGNFKPGSASIDFWPDLREFDSDEIHKTAFKHQDGKYAYVFSSANFKTVNRHFKWMKDYDIDGVFVQRFVTSLNREKKRITNYNQVFDNCFNAAKNTSRILSLMYDLSGSKSENVVETIINDWKNLVNKYQLNDPNNPNILTYKDKAVISIWGVGFNRLDNYTLDNIKELIQFFKTNHKYGNCSVLLGVPTGWRTLSRDAINLSKLHEVIKMSDIVHPWTPGRYHDLLSADIHKEEWIEKDKKWCDDNGLLYMPVVFPGFSWANLKNDMSLLNQIPRLKGDFLWRQFYNTISTDVKTIYVAMFDEIDEGTCIFKVTNNPPTGKSKFLTYEDLPSDYYLWLTGMASKMLKNKIPLTKQKPFYPNETN